MLAAAAPAAVAGGPNSAPHATLEPASHQLAAAHDEARAWLARSDRALARLSYRGVFVHEYGGETETLRVMHRVGSDGVSERLVSMDGSGREFIRRNGKLSCYLPDLHTVLVVKSSQPTLPLNVPQIDGSWAGQYDIRQVATARVSGHRTRVIAVTPLDALRYGYRVWIDEATAMPLKTQLRDGRGAVLEQIVFTQLALPARITDSELRPAVNAHKYRWVRQYAAAASVGSSGSRAQAGDVAFPEPTSWQASALPAGFRMTASRPQLLPSGPAEHLVFSDGLASVSVFIQRARAGRNVHITDAARLGSSSAYSIVSSGYRITAVGEVPPQTVRAIAQSMRGGDTGEPAREFGSPAATLPAMPNGLLPTLDVSGNGALLMLGNLGNGTGPNGRLGGVRGAGGGLELWPLMGPGLPMRTQPPGAPSSSHARAVPEPREAPASSSAASPK